MKKVLSSNSQFLKAIIVSGVFLLPAFAKKLRPTLIYLFPLFIFSGLIFLHIQQVSALATTNIALATGGTITTVKQNGVTYKVHTFTSSGTFTVLKPNLKVWYLVIGGGGGSSNNGGGGGGAGGYLENGSYTYAVNPQAYTITVGAGGIAGGGSYGTNGGDSVFDTITATGGGAGAVGVGGSLNGKNGGSGGGAHRTNTPGTGIAGQGTSGGQGTGSGLSNAGGGGGAGHAGYNGPGGTDIGGNGGEGIASSITGTSVTRASGGGGGGSTGGTAPAGGGGNGGSSTGSINGSNGTANTGGGAGGGSQTTSAGNGGSGIVIIRYPIGAVSKPIQKGGLVGHWTFDTSDISGTTVYDRSGNRNNGTISGPTTSGGKIGQALSFNGSSNYIRVPDANSLDITGAVTISFWLKTTTTANTIIFEKRESSNSNIVYGAVVNDAGAGGSNKIACYFKSLVGGDFVASTIAINDGAWRHIICTHDGSSTAKIFINGVVNNTASIAPTATGNAADFYIGSRDGTSIFTAMTFDDLRLYNRALSVSEVAQLYRSSGGTANVSPTKGISSGLVGYWTFDGKYLTNATATDSVGGNNGTLVGGPRVTNGKLGQAMNFDGVDDVVQTTVSSNLSGSFTFSAWIYPTSNAVGSGGIVNSEVASYSNYWASLYRGTPQSFNGSFSLFDGGNNPNVNTGDVPPLNKWTHLVGVRDTVADTISIYENGVFKNSVNDTTTSVPSYSNFNIGGQVTQSSRYFPGKVDDVRIYNRALSATEIMQLYRMGGR